MKLSLTLAFAMCMSGTFAVICYETDLYMYDNPVPRRISQRELDSCRAMDNECRWDKPVYWEEDELAIIYSNKFINEERVAVVLTYDDLMSGKMFTIDNEAVDIYRSDLIRYDYGRDEGSYKIGQEYHKGDQYFFPCVKDGYKVKYGYDDEAGVEYFGVEAVRS